MSEKPRLSTFFSSFSDKFFETISRTRFSPSADSTLDFASLGGFDVLVLFTLAEAVLEPFPELVLETIFFAGTFETFFPTALETGLAAVFPRVLEAFRLVTETFFAWDCFVTLVFEAVFLAVVLVGFGLAEGFDF